jgi:hypothetical protein
MRYFRRQSGLRGGILMRLLSWIVVIAMLTIFVLISQRGLKTPSRRAAAAPAVAANVCCQRCSARIRAARADSECA